MSPLANVRHERFAQLRAKGYSLEEAYEMAGFIRDSGHASRLARRPQVAGRIAALRLEIGQDAPRANLEQTIAGLLSLVERGAFNSSPQHLAEARVCLLEAHRLHELWLERRQAERAVLAAAAPVRRPKAGPAQAKLAAIALPGACHPPALSGPSAAP